MATSSSLRAASPRWSLNDLSPELLALVIEHLHDIDARSVAEARILCARLDAIATPILFRVLHLNKNIVSPDAESRYPGVFANIAAHTRHVVVGIYLDPSGINKVLYTAQNLVSVRYDAGSRFAVSDLQNLHITPPSLEWRYSDAELEHGRPWLPFELLDFYHERLRGIKLHVENLPLREFDRQQQDTYVRAIPAHLLVTLKMASPAPPLITNLHSLKSLLLLARRLETFHYEGRGQGTSFNFRPGERLPPFKELALRSYDWNHSKDETAMHWDFSNIRSLDLDLVPIFEFLSSINPLDLANLLRLHCEDYSAHLRVDNRQEATRGLYLLVKHYIRALHTLSITCHIRSFPIDAILAHSPSLRALRFRDHVGFRDEDYRCPTLSPVDVASLGRRLPYVHTLELDMDAALCEPSAFLRAVCTFRSLRDLTLHVQTVINPLEDVEPEADPDYDAVVQTLFFLHHCKKQAAEEWARVPTQARKGLSPVAPWSRITITVGGWRRVMARRFSTAWREQNQKGIFAERCFVAERCEEGRPMRLKEQGHIEMQSASSSPEGSIRNVDD
ncbi:F-box domain-containing protein [Sodiomyces alkalinus F11]|uniref:F-box domain-containing protein n=1 Tax=Sodiomyces alkalinus (strain CBS 110278 / VKM F-3762 / F11) TaxID=1314773 RepID=A0A3N2Q4F3_SODAK|nr:F-box domain-containing protein [Sodiomyces alkalinus F11]ROT41654.1 F-box domain-containing protein [Sodiomyces alkalinus F11]